MLCVININFIFIKIFLFSMVIVFDKKYFNYYKININKKKEEDKGFFLI